MAILTSTILLPRPRRVAQAIRAMIAPAAVDAEAVGDVLDQYGLQLAGAPKRVAAGRRNRNLLAPTDQGMKVLRRYRDGWPVTSIAYEHAILGRLAELDFPAPRLVRGLSGQTMVSRFDDHYALFDFVDGISMTGRYHFGARRRRMRAVSGRLLARLHRQLEGFEPQGAHHLGFDAYEHGPRRNLAWYGEAIPRLRAASVALNDGPYAKDAQWLAANADSLLERIIQLRQALQTVGLRRTIIHGDFGLHNLLFHHDGTVTLLDFELARLEWRLTELVMYAGRLGLEDGEVFLSAYHKVYPLSADEWEHLPQVWQLHHLEGAVQNWNTYFEQGIQKNLAAARGRIAQADYALAHEPQLRQLQSRVTARTGPQKPRVLMVARLFYPWIGGAERQAHRQARRLRELEIPVEIVTGWWFRGTPQREMLDGIPVYRNFTFWDFLGIKGLRKFGGYLYILTLVFYLWRRRDDYDVVHVHGLNYHTFAVNLAGRLTGRPSIAKLANSGQASDVEKMRQDRQLALARHMLPLALQCDRFVAINSVIVDELVAAGVAPERIVRIGNGIEAELVQPREQYRLGRPARLLYVGRLHPQKALDVLLQAIQLLVATTDLPLQLRLIGDGPARGDLTALADQLGLEDNVVFCGQSDQVMEELAAADVFVLPSWAEGLSNALLEAMAAGLPVVVSDIPGNVDVITHEQNGLHFKVGDSHSLANSLATLLAQEELRAGLGRAARQTVEEHYSMDAVVRSYVNLYQQEVRIAS